ncbi:MAG: biopolymer transporter ExbD [Candidatus Omnitrophica bacterium]|nr:biopolymer transporter ExbD [Candidatus Omnitrophota bacterium]
MRFKGRMELEHGLKQIDIAPLIDIIFQLLIFFMLTSSFVMQPGIKINLPKAVTSEIVSYDNIEVVVSGESVVYLDGKVITMRELEKLFIQAAGRNQTILIKADKRASLGRVVDIWDMARDIGISKINIATNQEE